MGCSLPMVRRNKSGASLTTENFLLFKPNASTLPHPSSIKKSSKQPMTPEMPVCYLFGINERKEECIISFDSSTERFTSNEIPQGLEIWNYSSALYLAPDRIVLSGGINKNYSEITKKVFLYNPVLKTVLSMPLMQQPRYTHMSTVFEDRLYVLGGRTYGSDDVALLSHVEVYDQKSQTWNVLAPMKKPRCTGFVSIYRQGLYVFGGYTGPLKRSKVIERFDQKRNQWDLLNFKLHRGIECGLLVSIKDDELILIGGQIRAGPTKTVVAYDFNEKTVHFRSKMSNARVLQKGFLFKDILYIFGGDNSSLVEKASINNWEWSECPGALFTGFVALDHIEKFSHSSPPLYVGHSNIKQAQIEDRAPNDEIFLLFGTDEEPFLMEFNLTKNLVRNIAVPLTLQLYCYQSGARLSDSEYFFCGGIHYQMDQIMRKAFIFSSETRTATVLEQMAQERYTFNCIYKPPYVYALAGRTYGEDNDAIMKRCERYSLIEKQWREIAPINQLRCSAMTCVLKGKIYLFGGYRGNGERESSFEVYDEIMNNWELLGVSLEEGIEASAVEVINDTRVLVLGGREVSGDTNKAFMVEKMKEDGELKIVEMGNIGNPRCLHKSYRVKNTKMNDYVLIFGGNDVKSIECYNMKKKKIEESDGVMKGVVDEFRFELEMFVGDIKLKRYMML